MNYQSNFLLGKVGLRDAEPRGLRNRNPGNIRGTESDPWKGQIELDSGGFVVFVNHLAGVRALARDLQTKYDRGLRNIRKIVEVYAPADDNNDVDRYIDVLCRFTAQQKDQLLYLNYSDVMLSQMMQGIIVHECGYTPYSEDFINAGIQLAR